MRKSLLALSIAALVGGAANAAVFSNAAAVAHPAGPVATALALSTTGVGHILTVPYFTTQGTNKTLLNITNTDTVNGKAVKLRFRGATNSDDIFDITVFLSPGDMWTAEVGAAEDGSGVSRLVTSDTSCTLPYKEDIKAQGGKFKTNRVLESGAGQTREGYIEILNTADIPVTLAAAAGDGSLTATTNPLYNATKHATSGATAGTPTCATAVLDLQENDLVAAGAAPNSWNVRGYNFPSGGLTANWTVVNVAGFASFSGEATAVVAQDTPVAPAVPTTAVGNLVWFPQTDAAQPNGGLSTVATALSADPLLALNLIQSAMYDYPDLSTPYTGAVTAAAQADALTSALATTAVSNEYITGNGFSTDWVFSQPTRRYHVAVNYAAAGAARLVFRDAIATGTDYFAPANTRLNVVNQIAGAAANTVACVTPGQLRAYNREELTRSTFVISPATALNLCGEVSVLSFNNTGASVLNGSLTRNDLATGTGLSEGWFRVATPSATTNPAVDGLPIIGYAASKVSGNNLGGSWTHRTAR